MFRRNKRSQIQSLIILVPKISLKLTSIIFLSKNFFMGDVRNKLKSTVLVFETNYGTCLLLLLTGRMWQVQGKSGFHSN